MSTLDLDALANRVENPDESARDQAREREDLLVKPKGSLGRLEDLAVWLAGVQGRCPPRPIERARVVVFAADHGIAANGVSAFPPEVTAQMVRALHSGGTALDPLAHLAGATVRIADMAVDDDLAGLPPEVSRHKVGRGSGRIDREDALTRDEAERAFAAGLAIADEEVDAGADLLVPGDMGVGNSTPAAVLVAVFAGVDAASATGRGTGIDDARWIRKCAAIRDALRRARRVVHDPLLLLATAGGADFAAMTGFLIQAAVRRTPVILDGIASAASAVVAQRIAPRAGDWWLAGQVTTEPTHAEALDRLSLTPVLDHKLGIGGGAGALLALQTLRAAGGTLAEMATFEEATVSPATGGG